MKAKVTLADLIDLIKTAKKAADTKSSLPTLRHVLLEAHSGRLIATCTDLSIAVITSIPAEVEGSGQALVPVKGLAEFLSKTGKGMCKKEKGQTPVRLVGVSHILSVEVEGFGLTELKGLDPSVEIVAISLVNDAVLANRQVQAQAKKIGQLATVDGQVLANAIKRITPALRKTSTGGRRQQTRPLSFIWMQSTAPDKITIQATNGSQLFSIDIPAQVQRSFSVGVRLDRVATLLQGDISLFFQTRPSGDSLHSITIQGAETACVLTTADLLSPGYQSTIRRLLEDPPILTITCSASRLAEVIDLSRGTQVGFDTDGETLFLLTCNKDAGLLAQANLEVEVRGQGRFVLQGQYVLDALKLLPDSDQVTLVYWQEIPDDKNSAIVKLTTGNTYAAIAVLRVDENWWDVPPIPQSEMVASVNVLPLLTQLRSVCTVVETTAPQPWGSVLLKGRPGRLQITGAKQTAPDDARLYKGDREETQVETAITASTFITGRFGQVVVPVKPLLGMLLRAKARKLTGVVITAVENGLRMSLGCVTISLAGIPAEKYPQIPTLGLGEGTLLSSFNASLFAKAVVWTHRASNNEGAVRAWCKGVWLEGDACGINTIAADGIRLHVAHVEANCAPGFVAQIVVLRHLEELVSALQGQVSMRCWGEGVFFHDGQTAIFCRRIDSNTPDYRPLLSLDTTPDQTRQRLKIEAPPDELLKRVSMVQQKDAAWTGFIASPDALTIATQAVENATVNKGRIAVLPEGYLGRFAINGQYTIDALSYGNSPVTIQAQFDEQGEVQGAILFFYQHPAALKKDLAEESLPGPMAQAVVMPYEVKDDPWADLEDKE